MTEGQTTNETFNYPSTEEAYEAVKEAGFNVEDFNHWLGNVDPTGLASVDPCFNVQAFFAHKESLKTLVIDEKNFDDHFFPCVSNAPRPGQILACYDAKADFIDGNLKRDIIHLLMTKDRAAEPTVRLMQKLAGATNDTAIQVVKEMLKDLMSGMSSDEVAEKPYDFQCQHFYYTYRECLPEGDPHWWSTALIDVKSFGLEDYLERNLGVEEEN